jgi:lipopolysaccharide/colanic/teichoic acid biosynthesis glycosyltransferase
LGTPASGAVKRALDLAFAVVLVLLTAPIVLLGMLAVRATSSGSPLYRQKRLGRAGRVFTIYKIRTMYRDSERWSGPVWSTPGDPRITPVGRFLRWSHLDELPQLLNVLRGEMSLVGPRPERPEIVAQIEHVLPGYRNRLAIRPGISGLAQILQDPESDLYHVRRKLAYDMFYIGHMGFWLDLRIMLATTLHLARIPVRSSSLLLRLPDSLAKDGDAVGAGRGIPVIRRVRPCWWN